MWCPNSSAGRALTVAFKLATRYQCMRSTAYSRCLLASGACHPSPRGLAHCFLTPDTDNKPLLTYLYSKYNFEVLLLHWSNTFILLLKHFFNHWLLLLLVPTLQYWCFYKEFNYFFPPQHIRSPSSNHSIYSLQPLSFPKKLFLSGVHLVGMVLAYNHTHLGTHPPLLCCIPLLCQADR